MKTKPYDQAFKYLAEQDAESLLIFLGYLRPNEKALIKALPAELSISTIVTDQTYLVKSSAGESIVHPEAQIEWDENLITRMPDYDARLWMKYRLPVYSYVLLLTKKGVPKEPPEALTVSAGTLDIVVHARFIKIWEMSARRVVAMNRESLLPFVPLMAGSDRALEQSVQRLREVRDEQRRRDLSLHFLMLGGLRYNREDLLEMIVERGMIPIQKFKDSSFYQMILDEGKEEGRKKGIAEGRKKGIVEGKAEGRAEGRVEGKEEGIAETLLLLLKERFPKLNVRRQVKSIKDAEALKQLFIDVMKLRTEDAVTKRIQSAMQQSTSTMKKASKRKL
jgi:predicted transposase YdaD